MNNDPFVRVGEHSRDIARTPIHDQCEAMKAELKGIAEKRVQVQNELSKLAEKKRELYRRVFGKPNADQLRLASEKTLSEERRPLIRELKALEERRADIEARLPDARERNARTDKTERSNVYQIVTLIHAAVQRIEKRLDNLEQHASQS